MISEAFAHDGGTVFGVQGIPGTGVTSIVINDAQFVSTNTGPQRSGYLVLTIDGNVYTMYFTLTEEAIDQRTIQGYTKRKNPNVKGR